MRLVRNPKSVWKIAGFFGLFILIFGVHTDSFAFVSAHPMWFPARVMSHLSPQFDLKSNPLKFKPGEAFLKTKLSEYEKLRLIQTSA